MTEIAGVVRGIPAPDDRWDESANELGALDALVVRSNLLGSDRALAKAYGPRKLGILQTRADIYKEKGDTAGSYRTLEEAVRLAESLPEGQRSEKTIASLRKKLEASP